MSLPLWWWWPGAVALSDPHPPDMWMVTGSILTFVEFGHEIISTAILSLPLIQEGQFESYWRKNVLSSSKLSRRLAQEQCG